MESLVIDVSELAGWTPYEGSGMNPWLKMDGDYQVVCKKAVLGTSDAGRPIITATIQILDEDAEPKGAILTAVTTVGGTDKNGKSMVRNLGDLLFAFGRDQATIAQIAAAKTLDLGAVCVGISSEGKNIGYVAAHSEEYKGRGNTKTNWSSKARYDEAKKGNTHRRPRSITESTAPNNAAGAAGASAAGASANGAATNGVAGDGARKASAAI